MTNINNFPTSRVEKYDAVPTVEVDIHGVVGISIRVKRNVPLLIIEVVDMCVCMGVCACVRVFVCVYELGLLNQQRGWQSMT